MKSYSRPKTCLSTLLVLLCVSLSTSSFAATKDAPTSNDAPSADEQSSSAGSGKHEHRNHKERMYGWQEIKSLPTLSGERKKMVQDLFAKSKTDSAPLVDELKQIRAKVLQGSTNSSNAAGSSTAAGPGPGAGHAAIRAAMNNATPEQKARMDELKSEIKDNHRKTWDQVNAILTDDDRKQLETLRQNRPMGAHPHKADAAMVPATKDSKSGPAPSANSTDAKASSDDAMMDDNGK